MMINISNNMLKYSLAAGLLLTGFSASFQAVSAPKISGDVRFEYADKDRDTRNGTNTSSSEYRVRPRVRVTQPINEKWLVNGRFAGRYSEDHDPNSGTKWYKEIPSGDGLRFGDGNLDEFYARYQHSDALRVTVGRMQTSFELDGVAKKSLDRNNSPNTDVTWTDALYVLYSGKNGWKHHGIIQYNYSEGATEVRRGPLDFSDKKARISYFYALENKKAAGPIVQRGIDLTYMPKSLCTDGTSSCNNLDDYMAITTRGAAKWPIGNKGMNFLLAGELGYAPNTQLESTAKIGTSNDVDGTAFQVTFNFLDFYPKHNIGLVYARADAGWLLSPDFRNNHDLKEIRYKWITAKNQKLEARYRIREELDKRIGAQQKQKDNDFYIRYTIKF